MGEINFVTSETRPQLRLRDRISRLRGGDHTVGITVDSRMIRAAHVRRDKAGTRVVQVAEAPLPLQTHMDGSVMNPAVFGDVLRELYHRLRSGSLPESARGVLLIGGHQAILKMIKMQLLTDDEFEVQFPWEAEPHIPYDINDVVIAREVVRRWPEQGEMDVLLAAAKRDEVAELLRIAQTAGFRIEAVEPSALALRRAMSTMLSAPGSEQETRVAIEVTEDLTTIAVLVGTSITFSRDIMHAYTAVVEALQKKLGVANEEGRNMIASIVAKGGEPAPDALGAIVAGEVDSIAGEIQRSLDFYLATLPHSTFFTSIALCGPGATLPGLRENVERRAKCPATLLDTSAGLGSLNLQTGVRTRCASAIGAALRTDFTITTQTQHSARVRDSRTNVVGLTRDQLRAREAREAKLRRPRKHRPSKEELARFLEVLDFTLAAGVTILDTLRIIASDPAIGGRRFRRAFEFVVKDISEGKSLVEALEWGFALPPLISCLIASLERSGELDRGHLRRAAQFIRTGSFGHGGEALPDFVQNALRRSA